MSDAAPSCWTRAGRCGCCGGDSLVAARPIASKGRLLLCVYCDPHLFRRSVPLEEDDLLPR